MQNPINKPQPRKEEMVVTQEPQRIDVYEERRTLRPISEGGEYWLGRPIKCLDYGFVYLVDYMGNDESVVQAARVSYGQGTTKINTARGLIRYLRRHMHTTPFEMIELKFHCKIPLFVARQWIRHRTASVNEYSGRYSIMSNEFYLPDSSVISAQSGGNRQGRGEELPEEKKKRVLELLQEDYKRAYQQYEEFIGPDFNLARELARIGLSLANYTEWYWKIDLHNLMHFLTLRMDAHAQYEIRVFADAMAKIVKDTVPICYSAFEDYQLNAMRLSGPETELIKKYKWPKNRQEAWNLAFERFDNKRESDEFVNKIAELGMISE